MSNQEVEHLESFTAFYEGGDSMDDLMIEREIDLIRKYCATGRKRTLEVGCGNGNATRHLAALFPDIEVVEPARGNIDLLLSKLPNVVCHNQLLEQFRPTAKYDYIFFLNVIEHVEDPIAALQQLSGFLADDGLIFISAPNCMSLNRRAGYLMGLLDSYSQFAPKDLLVGHRRLYTTRMLNDHCTAAGLRIVDMKGIYLKPLAEKQMLALGENALRAFLQLGEDIPEYCASLFAAATKKYY